MERAFSSQAPTPSLANSPLYLFVGPTVALSVPFLGQELVLKEGSTLDYFKPVNTYLPNSLLRATS